MDQLLGEFFQAELPHPWPAFRPPASSRPRREASGLSRYASRLALAACIALLAAGYLTLAGFFPRQQTSTGVDTLQPGIGMIEKSTPKK